MISKNVRHALRLFWTNLRVMRRHDVLIEKNVTIKYDECLRVGRHVTLQSGCYLYGSREGKSVVLGDFVVIACGAIVLGEGGVELGAFTHLGPGAVITSQYGDSNGAMAAAQPQVKTAPVVVGKGCWIGSGAVLMPGAELGDECVVAPNSVVFGRWSAGSRVGGNPARRMGRTGALREVAS